MCCAGPRPAARRRLSGADPLKMVKGFVRAPKKGDTELTDMEKAALAKKPKKGNKHQAGGFQPKRNVRKGKLRKR